MEEYGIMELLGLMWAVDGKQRIYLERPNIHNTHRISFDSRCESGTCVYLARNN